MLFQIPLGKSSAAALDTLIHRVLLLLVLKEILPCVGVVVALIAPVVVIRFFQVLLPGGPGAEGAVAAAAVLVAGGELEVLAESVGRVEVPVAEITGIDGPHDGGSCRGSTEGDDGDGVPTQMRTMMAMMMEFGWPGRSEGVTAGSVGANFTHGP